jgi:hypothetical protein
MLPWRRSPFRKLSANILKKRRIAALPHRISPKLYRHASPSFPATYTSHPAPPTITPADSDSEETPTIAASRSTILVGSSPDHALMTSSPGVSSINTPQSDGMFNTTFESDDFEMADSILLSPGPFHHGASTTISGRVPTPIHSSFAPHIRAEKAFRYSDPDFADDEAMADKFCRGRDLPSPISEGAASPSIIADGLSDMQMETMEEIEKNTPTKKGHSRSKHSLRSWAGFGMDVNGSGAGPKKTFSMGYRADCEKCRNKVPGHFSHIIQN